MDMLVNNSSQNASLKAATAPWNGSESSSTAGSSSDLLFFVVDKILIPAVCVSGVAGNLLCVAVLARERLQRHMDSQEKVVHVGFVAMAVAEMLLCLCLVPRSFVHVNRIRLPTGSFALFYQLYSTGFMTTFSLVTTWLIVVTAGIRYLGICHPLRARYLVSPKGAYTVIGCICALSCLGNLPTFWIFKTIRLDEHYELIDIGPFSHRHARGVAFLWAKNILGVFVPCIMLAYFNIRLILALRASSRLQYERVREAEMGVRHVTHQEACRNRLTRTLVAIVAIFILLVFPCELMDFFIHLTPFLIVDTKAFIIARVIANLVQVLNFAFNFLLYCILSVTFRHGLRSFAHNIVTSCRPRCGKEKQTSATDVRGKHMLLTNARGVVRNVSGLSNVTNL